MKHSCKKGVKRKPIRRVSKKYRKELDQYRVDAKEFIRLNTGCFATLEGCTKRSTEVHHLAGRGSLLNAKRLWRPVCPNCHRIIHDVLSMEEAVSLGLRIKK
ncbi:hypothetical protein LZD49_26260 [Dyadobacter sp. CY261]|uniref:hypothetical protein n=1 Tax=Dyadobacter sp. CY261 TaxID=2907203 RepID=UPI001F24E787|nr:hypothetical protein [Dyadobacter sp. CY261]MCF0074013.1 hypothetical protein [Dyadobacter sp. CY261]